MLIISRIHKTAAVFLVLALSASFLSAAFAAYSDFSDVSGHWAGKTLEKAYNDGLLEGFGGRLEPDAPLSAAQAITVLCRVLGASRRADISDLNLPSGAWYADAAACALYLKLIPDAPQDFTLPLKRVDAFSLLCAAFELSDADPDLSLLAQFSDSRLLSGDSRRVIASLVSRGLVTGYSGALNPNGSISRAEFMTVLYRIAENYPASGSGDRSGGSVFSDDTELSGRNFNSGVWLDCNSREARLTGLSAPSVTIRSHSLTELAIQNSDIDRLVIASQSGNVTINPDRSSQIAVVAVGRGGGEVSVSSDIKRLEITGDDRSVTVKGNVSELLVSGSGNTITIDSGVTVSKMTLLQYGANNRVIVNGRVSDLTVSGRGSILSGSGSADICRSTTRDCQVSLRVVTFIDGIDYGLDGVTLEYEPEIELPAGETLEIVVKFKDMAAESVRCSYSWSLDGSVISEGDMDAGASSPATLSYNFEYTPDMPTDRMVELIVSYTTSEGEYQELRANISVRLENFSEDYFWEFNRDRVLELVTTGYKGDYTLEWAEANDYKTFEKEIWVNAKNYSSESQYLIWVSLAYQRVNIFEGSAGNWRLIRSGIVGTGALGSGTPVGVWKITYKQEAGWVTYSYTVRPVVGFKGGGYAFHSRLYRPGTTILSDDRIGFPVSAGCIRMYDEDINWIFDNVPVGTTVVVY